MQWRRRRQPEHRVTVKIITVYLGAWHTAVCRCSNAIGGSVGRWPPARLRVGSVVVNVDSNYCLQTCLFLAWFMHSGIDEFIQSDIICPASFGSTFLSFSTIYPFRIWLHMLSDAAMWPKYCNLVILCPISKHYVNSQSYQLPMSMAFSSDYSTSVADDSARTVTTTGEMLDAEWLMRRFVAEFRDGLYT